MYPYIFDYCTWERCPAILSHTAVAEYTHTHPYTHKHTYIHTLILFTLQ